MEGLRHSLLAPAGATVMMIFSCADAMKTMVMTKYSMKDDNGKLLFPHPFAPWTSVNKEHEEKADKVLRAYRMFENVKEWTFMSLPLMWIYATNAESVPYVTKSIVDITVLTSTLVYVIGNKMFVSGYIESAEKRIKGFSLRMKVFKFWLFGSAAVVACTALEKYGII